jgi:hypothetical protein
MGFGVSLHGSKFEPLMSALGQKRTLECVRAMSALPPKADIGTGTRVPPATHQLRQLGDVRRDPARFTVNAEPLVGLAGARFGPGRWGRCPVPGNGAAKGLLGHGAGLVAGLAKVARKS